MFVTHTLQNNKMHFDRADRLQVLENKRFSNVIAKLVITQTVR